MNYPKYYSISANDLEKGAKIPFTVVADAGEMHFEYALQMMETIIQNNVAGKNTVFICPCGPTDQYPIFARLVNERRVSLKNTWIINMDEYLTDDGQWVGYDSQFSFHAIMDNMLYNRIDPELVMPKDQRVFPDPNCPEKIGELIEKLGGVDMVMGGIAVNGHIAFNEPDAEKSVEEFAALPTRVVELTPETRIKDAILGRGGAIDIMPKKAISVGMKEMLSAKKLLLSMANNMQRAVIRRALHGEVTSECPITFVQNHPNAQLLVIKSVTERPF